MSPRPRVKSCAEEARSRDRRSWRPHGLIRDGGEGAGTCGDPHGRLLVAEVFSVVAVSFRT